LSALLAVGVVGFGVAPWVILVGAFCALMMGSMSWMMVAMGRTRSTVTERRPGYPQEVAIARLRGRMPLVVFILLALVCLGLLGFACACLSDQPAAALERRVQAPALAPAVVEVWPAILFGVSAAELLVFAPVAARGRASPELLQRFLF
jgi:hypothetical protein